MGVSSKELKCLPKWKLGEEKWVWVKCRWLQPYTLYEALSSKSGTCVDVQSGDTSALGRDRIVAESTFCCDN